MHLNKQLLCLFIACLFPFVVHAGVPVAERNALMALYNDTNGAGWTDSGNWTTGDPCANSWYGITCDAGNTTVTIIRMGSNSLSGTLPAQLGDLPNLGR